MRALPTLGVYGWLLAAMALAALGVLEGVTGIARAQQLSPPASDGPNLFQHGLNLLQKERLFREEPLFRRYEGLVGVLNPGLNYSVRQLATR